MSLTADFNATARDYDAARRRLIPCFDDFYGAALALLPFSADDTPAILDLGAGTGLLSGLLRSALPKARLHLVDVSEDMLDLARQRLAGDPLATFAVTDFADDLPAGPWDAVASALAIHHLDDDGKRALFGRLAGVLKPGGVFVNAEQVLGPTPAAEAFNRALWHRSIRAAGATDEDIAGSARRMAHDRCAPLLDQMVWLQQAGFQDVDCLYKNGMFAVYGGHCR